MITDYNACKMWSTVKYAESEKREEIITDNLGYWIHVPLLKACMEHKGYKYVGPETGHPLPSSVITVARCQPTHV